MRFERFEESIVKTVDEMQPGDLFKCAYGDEENIREFVFISAKRIDNGRIIETTARLPVGELLKMYSFTYHSDGNKYLVVGKAVDDETV